MANRCVSRPKYTQSMIEEGTFRNEADRALEQLKQALIGAEEDGGFEVEENNGVLNVSFVDQPGKFVLTPNTPVRQIWISAQSTSFKLDWNEATALFVLPKTSESLERLIERLLREHTGNATIALNG